MTPATEGPAPATDPTDHITSGTWAGNWILDPTASSVQFCSTSMWGLVKVKGRFSSIRGAGSLGPDGIATGTLEIDASSVDTANKRRDKHLRSRHFLNAATHPTLAYTASGISPDGPGQVRVTGQLRVLDHTHPLELTANVEEGDPTGATVSTAIEFDQARWGVDFNQLGAIGKTTVVEARLRFTRASSPR